MGFLWIGVAGLLVLLGGLALLSGWGMFLVIVVVPILLAVAFASKLVRSRSRRA